MDPATAIGLAVSVQQLLVGLLEYSKDTLNAKKEIRRLSIEVSMLRAVLEQAHTILDPMDKDTVDDSGNGDSILLTSNFATLEFRQMIESTQELLAELQALLRPDTANGGHVQLVKKAFRRAMWHFDKKQAEDYITRIERAKSWFILALTTDDTKLCREMYPRIHNMEKIIHSLEKRQEEQEMSQLKTSIAAWLAPHNSYSKYKHSLEALQEGTGEWFLEATYQEWMSGNLPAILWLKAKPGFGKTTLMAAAIDRAHKTKVADSTRIVAYHFCSFSEQLSQDSVNILGSLIVQLCEKDPVIWQWIDQRYYRSQDKSARGSEDKLKTEELVELLVLVLERLGPALFFIDAVNESKEPESLLGILTEIAEKCTSARIMLSSTEEIATRTPDEDNKGSHSQLLSFVPIEKEANLKDIRTYVNAELDKRRKLRQLPRSLKTEVAFTLQKKAHGVFRWVQCQLDSLSDVRRTQTIQEIRKSLESLPATLE